VLALIISFSCCPGAREFVLHIAVSYAGSSLPRTVRPD